MRTLKRGLILSLVGAIGAGLIFALIYPGPRATLVMKGDLFGLGKYDVTLIKTIDGGWRFGKIFCRYNDKIPYSWTIVLPLGNRKIEYTVSQVFYLEKDREEFIKITKKAQRQPIYSPGDFYHFLISAKGLAAVFVDVEDIPILVLEWPAITGVLTETWRNPNTQEIFKAFSRGTDFQVKPQVPLSRGMSI